MTYDFRRANLSKFAISIKSISECYPCPLKELVGQWSNNQKYLFNTKDESGQEGKIIATYMYGSRKFVVKASHHIPEYQYEAKGQIYAQNF